MVQGRVAKRRGGRAREIRLLRTGRRAGVLSRESDFECGRVPRRSAAFSYEATYIGCARMRVGCGRFGVRRRTGIGRPALLPRTGRNAKLLVRPTGLSPAHAGWKSRDLSPG